MEGKMLQCTWGSYSIQVGNVFEISYPSFHPSVRVYTIVHSSIFSIHPSISSYFHSYFSFFNCKKIVTSTCSGQIQQGWTKSMWRHHWQPLYRFCMDAALGFEFEIQGKATRVVMRTKQLKADSVGWGIKPKTLNHHTIPNSPNIIIWFV